MAARVLNDGSNIGGEAVDRETDRTAPVDQRILAATLRCIARGGVAGLTLDDVAREAGCGRATVYRTFPAGKVGVIEAAVITEFQRFMAEVGADLEAADSLEDLLAAALTGTARFMTESAPLRYLILNEPAVILAHVAFDQSQVVFDAAHHLLAPGLSRFVDPSEVPMVAEWVARLGLSYLALPFATVDLTDATAARHLVATFLLPGLADSRADAVIDRSSRSSDLVPLTTFPTLRS